MKELVFTACMVAGGKSSRMGRDKAEVEFCGEQLWKKQLDTLRKTGANEILISGRVDACYADSGVRIIEDEINNAGPVAGIASLLSAASHSLVLILAIDMPYISADFLGNLLTKCGNHVGVVPQCNGIYEGMAAIYPKCAVTVAREILQQEDFSLQKFVRNCVSLGLLATVEVSPLDASFFRSLNTPEDLAIAVLFFSTARQVAGIAETRVFSLKALNTDELWRELLRMHPNLLALRPQIRLARNGQFVQENEIFYSGDEVALLPPVSGG